MPQPLDRLVREATAGDGGARQVRAAARLMSLLESEPQRLPELFRVIPLEEWPQPRVVLGLTGAPGTGKSTLTDQLVAEFRQRHPERHIGVIAVDPSSPFTGGSVLGDRVRMMRHATDPQVYIRSLASRGHLGGLSLGVKGVLRILGLIGCDTVLIETVGVGQSEVEVASVADLVLVVLAPGQGDSIQMLKAGLMEIGDVFVVNKADREGADALHKQLLSTLSLGQSLELAHAQDGAHGAGDELVDTGLADALLARRRPGMPEIYLASAHDRTGVPELYTGLEARTAAESAGWRARRRADVWTDVREAVLEEARRRLGAALNDNGREPLQRVLAGELGVAELTLELLRHVADAG